MEHELAHELPAEIKKAVALGDLSENAEYHCEAAPAVRERAPGQSSAAWPNYLVNLANIPHDKAGFGSTIVVYDSSKEEEIEYKLVTSEESM